MRAGLIIEGDEYAYSHGNGQRGPYLKATILSAPVSGKVRIRLSHPDEHVEDWEDTVATRLIAGRWSDTPNYESSFTTDYLPDEEQPPPPSDRDRLPFVDRLHMTFERHAATKWNDVLEQRVLAARLRAIGIDRADRGYANKGGKSDRDDWSRITTKVTEFTRSEVEHLLTAIEKLKAEEPVAYLATDFDPEGGEDTDVIGAHTNLFAADDREGAQRYAEGPGPVDSRLMHGPVRVYRVVRDS